MEKEILETVNENPYDIVLVGSSRDLFKDDKTGGVVKAIIDDTESAVGVLIDKKFKKIEKACLILNNANDLFLLKYAQRFLQDAGPKNLAILDKEGQFSSASEVAQFPGIQLTGNFTLVGKSADENGNLAKKFDLVIVSLEFWENLKRNQGAWLSRMPSVLIINR